MKRAKYDYKLYIAEKIKLSQQVFSTNLNSKLLSKDMCGFWKVWNATWKNNRNHSTCVGGCSSSADIAEKFRNHFANVCIPNNNAAPVNHASVFYDFCATALLN